MCILSVHTLLKVVGYYDLSVLSMSVMGYKKLDGGWVGGVSSIQFFLAFFDFFNFAKPLRPAQFIRLMPTTVSRQKLSCRQTANWFIMYYAWRNVADRSGYDFTEVN